MRSPTILTLCASVAVAGCATAIEPEAGDPDPRSCLRAMQIVEFEHAATLDYLIEHERRAYLRILANNEYLAAQPAP